MEIRCQQCREPVPADDVNLETVLAKCRKCNSVFDFSGQVDRRDPTPAKARRDKGDIPMPAAFKIDDDGRTLTLTKRWARGPGCFFLFFAAFWNGITWTIAIGTFAADAPAFARVLMIPFILIGFATAYAACAFLSNRTIIQVDGERLTVRSKPIPWPGARDLACDTLDQLWVAEYVAYTQNNVPQFRLAVEAMLKDGTKLRLVPGLEDPDQALYLEGLLEKRLNIVDRPMGGELR